MDTEFLTYPFVWGLGLGLLLAGFLLFRLWSTKGELKRYRRHLSDKLELEADVMKQLKADKAKLEKENENLRVKVSSYNEMPDRRAQRDLEVFARAEKQLLVHVPGFAAPWEKAKAEAMSEVREEEEGKSVSKRVFSKLFGGPVLPEKTGGQEPVRRQLLEDEDDRVNSSSESPTR